MKRKLSNLTVLTIGLMSLALVSCGNADVSSETSSISTESSSSIDETSTTTTDSNNEIDEDSTEIVEETDNTAYEYTDAAGRTLAFEETPERIAVTYLPLWESALMLDIKPVAAGGVENYLTFWKPFDGLDLVDTIDIGQKETNMEVLTTADADLILMQANDIENPGVEPYEAIATTAVFGNETKTDWRLSLREVGALLNCSEKAEEAIAEVDATLADARENFNNQYEDQTVMMLSMMTESKLYMVYRDDLYDKETGLGLNTPEGFTTEAKYSELPLENLVNMNPNHLFLNVFPENQALYDELQQNPLWQSLDCVKNNQVYIIDGPGHSISPLSTVYTINYIIDTLNK